MQKTIESDIRSDRVVNHEEEVVVINEVPIEVVPVTVPDSVIVDGVVDPHAVVVNVNPVQGRNSMKSKYLPLAGLIIGMLSISGSTAAATIEASSEIADQIEIGKTISANNIHHIQISRSEISNTSRINILPAIDANIQDIQIHCIAK